jgi:hypothetical protein
LLKPGTIRLTSSAFSPMRSHITPQLPQDLIAFKW